MVLEYPVLSSAGAGAGAVAVGTAGGEGVLDFWGRLWICVGGRGGAQTGSGCCGLPLYSTVPVTRPGVGAAGVGLQGEGRRRHCGNSQRADEYGTHARSRPGRRLPQGPGGRSRPSRRQSQLWVIL